MQISHSLEYALHDLGAFLISQGFALFPSRSMILSQTLFGQLHGHHEEILEADQLVDLDDVVVLQILQHLVLIFQHLKLEVFLVDDLESYVFAALQVFNREYDAETTTA